MPSYGRLNNLPTDDIALTFAEMKAVVRGLVRFPNLLKSALRVDFSPALFNGVDEQGLYLFVVIFSNLYDRHGVVTKDMFLSEIESMSQSRTIAMGPNEADFLFGESPEADGFIDFAFAPPARELEPAELRAERTYVSNILRRFLNARLLKQQLKKLIGQSNDNTSPLEFQQLLSNFNQQAQAIKFLGNEAVNSAPMPAIGEELVLPPKHEPTTIAWIDNFIDGFRAGDVIGMLGPYAGGKTTMLSTVAIRLAQQYAANNQNKLAVYICYEDGAQKLNYTFYSAAAHIERAAFINKTSEEVWAGLSTRETLKPYERNIPVNANAEILLCERDRWSAVEHWYNTHFVFLDFSSNPETGGRGNGGVHEIVATLENLVAQTGMQIGLVCIDYASIMLNREMAKNVATKYQEQIWRQLQQLPDELKTHVGIPFSCTVFLAHQLAGSDIKNIPPYRHVTHYDAQGSKAFAENLHACLCLNAADPECRVATINWSKIRFGRPASPFGLVQIDENVVDVRSVDGEYYVNSLAKKIMRRDDTAPTEHNGIVVGPSETRRRVMPNIDTFGSDLL
jgi:hypothetical protein